MTLYYEIYNSFDEAEYFSLASDTPFSKCRPFTMRAHRIWSETSEGVVFIKNRIENVNTKVDLKEFFWIKLKSQWVNG